TLAQAFQEAGFLTAAFTAGEAATRQSIPGFGFFQNEVGPDADYAAVRHAIEWLRAQGTAVGKNLFVWLHLAGPAAPYDPVPVGKTGFGDRFVDPDYAGSANGSLDYLAAARSPAADVSGQDLGQVTALYDAEIARVNHLVLGFVGAYAGTYGTLPVDHLTDTVLVFAADRGEELFQRNRAFEHPASVYDSALHVPLVFHHPGSLTGSRVVQEPVELADVMPTLLDWFQIDAPEGIEGRSLLPLVDSYVERPFDSRPVFGLWGDRIATARTSRFRLVWNPEGVDPGAGSGRSYPVPVLALFDHQRDPRELVDVAAEHPEVVAALREAIQGWLADGGDPLLLERFQ
ncbi:MAG: sulfatase-like hydrolase/transferase, partial [Planctomycetota bacterium]|nr:sulfatase-like hydrolase/transferase [Planctomycetota bacterium]